MKILRTHQNRSFPFLTTQPFLDFMYDLNFLFDQLNSRFWSGKLPRFQCEWSNRMITTWGCCYRSIGLIRISSFFRSRPLAEVAAVLLHEMAHIKHPGHGRAFRRELERIGMAEDVEGCFPHLNDLTNAMRRALRYQYECPKCRVRIKRRRKIRGYCADCYNSGSLSRFRLITTT
jgi:predicted SprT family Zn-dependent metalloprotease